MKYKFTILRAKNEYSSNNIIKSGDSPYLIPPPMSTSETKPCKFWCHELINSTILFGNCKKYYFYIVSWPKTSGYSYIALSSPAKLQKSFLIVDKLYIKML